MPFSDIRFNNQAGHKLVLTLINYRKVFKLIVDKRIVSKIPARGKVTTRLFKTPDDAISYADAETAKKIAAGYYWHTFSSSKDDPVIADTVDLRINKIDVPLQCKTWQSYINYIVKLNKERFKSKVEQYNEFTNLNYEDQKKEVIRLINESSLANEFKQTNNNITLFALNYFPGCSNIDKIFKKLISI